MAERTFTTIEELAEVFEYKGLTIREWADKITAEEYQPVKHGEWEDVKFSEGVYKEDDDSNDIGLSITSARCSLCQRYSEMLQQYRPKMPAYCSHCGAKMDLKDGGEVE